jgi:hypothetical protein
MPKRRHKSRCEPEGIALIVVRVSEKVVDLRQNLGNIAGSFSF